MHLSLHKDSFLFAHRRIILAVLLTTSVFLMCFYIFGYHNTLIFFGMSAIGNHPFADSSVFFQILKVFPQQHDFFVTGIEHMVSGDKVAVNYPSIWWKTLHFLGVLPEHKFMFCVAIIALFLVGICLVLPHASYGLVFAMLVALVSPVVLLGIERGNTDLLMFFFVACAIFLLQKDSIWPHLSACFLLLTAFVLKLFPIFAALLIIKWSLRKMMILGFVMLLFCIFYTLVNFTELSHISENVPKEAGTSYGYNVIATGLYRKILWLSDKEAILQVFFLFNAFLLAGLAWFIAFFKSGILKVEVCVNDTYIDAFRAGAAVYIGTFFLGNNFDYRLMFLLLIIPQVYLWLRASSDKRWSLFLGCLLAAVYFSLYISPFIFTYIPSIMFIKYVIWLLNELSNWFIFTGLSFLLFLTLPQHLRWGRLKTS